MYISVPATMDPLFDNQTTRTIFVVTDELFELLDSLNCPILTQAPPPLNPLIVFHVHFFTFKFAFIYFNFQSMLSFIYRVKFHVTGDLIEHSKPSLIIMNHRTRLDWLFFFSALYKMDPWLLTTEKISLKAGLKQIPGAGWAMGCG